METTVHDFSGFLPMLRLSESFALPTYFLIVSLAFCICLIVLVNRTKKLLLNRNTALDLSLILMISGFIGARLLHVVFEAPQYYAADLSRIFDVWRGGFVWYGGAILAGLSTAAYMKIKKLPPGKWVDCFAPVLALGYGLGRIACVFAGCCNGAVCTLMPGYQFRYPTQGVAVFWELGVFVLLLRLEKMRGGSRAAARWIRAPGQLFASWVVLHSIGRVIMEIFRADNRGPAIAGLSLATWISAFLLCVGAAALVRNGRRSD